MHLRKTKLIATLGPAVSSAEKITKLIAAGVDVLRFNFSHLTPQLAEQYLKQVKQALKKEKRAVALLADLKGPEIRTDPKNTYEVKRGDTVSFCYGEGTPAEKRIGIDHAFLYRLVKKGQLLSAADGHFEFKVTEVKAELIYVKVIRGGTMTPNRAINVPGLDLQLPFLDERDQASLRYILKKNFSWVAASFISSCQELQELRAFMQAEGKGLPVIAKIENRKALENLSTLIEAADGVMVARGDLGLEVPYEAVPALQNLIISKSKEKGKVIIVATQMLESMMNSHRPSRAEVTDIYYAVRRKVDAVMLSAETASGAFPVEAVRVMSSIIKKTEEDHVTPSDYSKTLQHYRESTLFKQRMKRALPIIPICEAGLFLASRLKSKGVMHVSFEGASPAIISSFRPALSCVVLTGNRNVYERSALYYSVMPILIKRQLSYMTQIENVISLLVRLKVVKKGEELVLLYPKSGSKLLDSIRRLKVP